MIHQKKVVLFGGGPACLMAAYELSKQYDVHLYEKGKRLGRKFLIAGNGGFNLTNEAFGEMLQNQYSDHSILHQSLNQFDSNYYLMTLILFTRVINLLGG